MSRATGLRLAAKLAAARAVMKLARAGHLPLRERAYRRAYRNWYDAISEFSGLLFAGFHCMNYGYAPAAQAGGPERFQLSLYDFLASLAPVRGRQVLEVGSGRGGGAAHLRSRHEALAVTGLDVSESAVAESRQRFRDSGLRFLPGNAEALTFGDASFDIVFNVESSHCYPDFDRFLSEAHRVLVAGGTLLLADFRHRRDTREVETQIHRSRFKVLRHVDITANVVAALEADNDRKRSLIDSSPAVPGFIRSSIHHFAGCVGTPMYEDFQSGRRRYFVYALTAI